MPAAIFADGLVLPFVMITVPAYVPGLADQSAVELFSDQGNPGGVLGVFTEALTDPGAQFQAKLGVDEPNYQAGVYRGVLLRRWRNTLGRTMWDFPGGPTGGNQYLVHGPGAGQAADPATPPGRDDLIAFGPLLSGNGTTRLGTAVLARAPDPDTAGAVLTPGRYAGIEVHNWQLGGRPS